MTFTTTIFTADTSHSTINTLLVDTSHAEDVVDVPTAGIAVASQIRGGLGTGGAYYNHAEGLVSGPAAGIAVTSQIRAGLGGGGTYYNHAEGLVTAPAAGIAVTSQIRAGLGGGGTYFNHAEGLVTAAVAGIAVTSSIRAGLGPRGGAYYNHAEGPSPPRRAAEASWRALPASTNASDGAPVTWRLARSSGAGGATCSYATRVRSVRSLATYVP